MNWKRRLKFLGWYSDINLSDGSCPELMSLASGKFREDMSERLILSTILKGKNTQGFWIAWSSKNGIGAVE